MSGSVLRCGHGFGCGDRTGIRVVRGVRTVVVVAYEGVVGEASGHFAEGAAVEG